MLKFEIFFTILSLMLVYINNYKYLFSINIIILLYFKKNLNNNLQLSDFFSYFYIKYILITNSFVFVFNHITFFKL